MHIYICIKYIRYVELKTLPFAFLDISDKILLILLIMIDLFCVGQVTGDGRRVTSGRITPTGLQENQTILPMRTALTSPASSGTTRSATMRTTSFMVFMPCVRYRSKPMFVFQKLPHFTF